MPDTSRERPAAGVVRVIGPVADGTGFVTGDGTLVVTSAHTVVGVRKGEPVDVVPHGTHHPVTATLVLDDEPTDVAVLELPQHTAGPLVALPLAGGAARPGDALRTFGYPNVRATAGLPADVTVVGPTRDERDHPQVSLRSDEVTVGFSGAPLWHPQLNAVVGMVKSITTDDPGNRLRSAAFGVPTDVIRELWPALQLPVTCPYRGLEPFTADDAEFYRGRDDAIAALCAAMQRRDVVAVVAVSGSGKSSLLQAGLARAGLTGDVRYLRITADPVEQLRSVIAAMPAGRQTVVVDQFERLYTTCDAPRRDAFIDMLLGLVPGTAVVIGLRADFYPAALADTRLRRHLSPRDLVTLAPMNADQIRAAIVEPAAAMHHDVEPRLVDQLIADVCGHPGDLPLLQFALTQLWERDARTGPLTHHTYLELGSQPGDELGGSATSASSTRPRRDSRATTGVQRTLIAHAEQWWHSLTPDAQIAARDVLLSLVGPGALGPNVPGAFRALSGRQAATTDYSEHEQQVIAELIENRLVTSGRGATDGHPVIELAHEALVQSWPRICPWIEDEHDFLHWRATVLSPYMTRWLRTGHDRHLLLPQPLLADARLWLQQRGDRLSDPQVAFITASKRWAELQARRAYLRRTLVGAVGTGVGLGGALAYLMMRAGSMPLLLGLWALLAIAPAGALVGFAIGMSQWWTRSQPLRRAWAAAAAAAVSGGCAYALLTHIAELDVMRPTHVLTGALLTSPVGFAIGADRPQHRVSRVGAITVAGVAGVVLATVAGVAPVVAWDDSILAGGWVGACTALGFASRQDDDRQSQSANANGTLNMSPAHAESTQAYERPAPARLQE